METGLVSGRAKSRPD